MSLLFPTPNNIITRNRRRRHVRPTRTPKTETNNNIYKYKSKINGNNGKKLMFNESDNENMDQHEHELLRSIKKLSLKKVNKTQSKLNVITITKSERIFNKKHKFGKILVETNENGSGCCLYLSKWNDEPSGMIVICVILY